MAATTYAIALGANVRGRYGPPERALGAALHALDDVIAVSPTFATSPLGPSLRRYANAVAMVKSPLDPPAMLLRLKAIERAFGRRAGRRWGARVLDLDIVLWSGGAWAGRGLVIPHPAFRARAFVLRPLLAVAPEWRDPLTGRTIRQLLAAVDRPQPRP